MDENNLGMANGLNLGANFIAPEKIDPTVNLAPLTLGNGFKILLDKWRQAESISWVQVERFSVWMVDGDPATTYQCLSRRCSRSENS